MLSVVGEIECHRLALGSRGVGCEMRTDGIRLSEKFLSFYQEIIYYNVYILFCRITYDPFCSVEINTATFHKLGFTFVRRCTVVENMFAKGRHFSDNLNSK